MGGCCPGSASDPQNRAVQRELDEAKKDDSNIKKLLLLGAGGSGKSTFFKQLKTIHGSGFSQFERMSYKQQIYRQIVEAMQQLVTQCHIIAGQQEETERQAVEVPKEEINEYIIPPELKPGVDHLFKLDPESPGMDPQVAKHIANLWKSDAIKKMFAHRNKLAIADSTSHFFDSIDRISEESYIPSDEDILYVRYRTTGMTEKVFSIEKTNFRVVDVGGQRNERKKWINFFDSVEAVLFVVSLSCYDEVPFEEVMDLDIDLQVQSNNNMLESIEVFETTLDTSSFAKTTFILFLNKSDLMQEKISRVPITVAFPEYSGPQEYEPSVQYIREQFESRNENPNRDVFSHITCATDKNNVEKVFHDVQVSLVNQNLDEADLL